MSSLNPVHTVGTQVAEASRAHRTLSKPAARAEALALFRRVGIADPERRLDAYPHELSGGMRQRVMIAIAVANRPALLIADEPTTALDVTIQAQILDLLADLRRESGMALIFITHNLGIVAEIADRVVVMYAGQVVEQGRVAEVFAAPLHPYTQALLAAVPSEDATPGRDPRDRAAAAAGFPRAAASIRAAAARPRRAEQPQVLREVTPGRLVACIHAAPAREAVRMNAAMPAGALVSARGATVTFNRGGLFSRAAAGARRDRRRSRHRARRGGRPGRRVRLGQEHARAPAARPAAADRRPCELRGPAPRRRSRGASGARCAGACRSSSRIPMAASIRAAASARRSPTVSRSTASPPARALETRSRAASCGGRARSEPCGALSARVLRRPAPAHRHRARARARSGLPGRRRAGQLARRLDPGADHGAARPRAARAQARAAVHQPRPAGGAPALPIAS